MLKFHFLNWIMLQLHPPSPAPWVRQQSYTVGQPLHTCIPSWTSNSLPLRPSSTALYSQLPGLFIGLVSFPHLQGGRVVTVGPQRLSGVLHGNENAPCWCRNLFLSLSPCRLARHYFVVHMQCSMWCKDNAKKAMRVNKIPLWVAWGVLTWITLWIIRCLQ